MTKRPIYAATLSLLLTSITLLVVGCDSNSPDDETSTILVGGNFEITGTQPDVGRHSRQAAEMFVDETNADGGLEVGGKKYMLELVVADNLSTGDGAVAVANVLLGEDNALLMVGPNLSNAAVPAGAVANALKTVMISPASTNPNTTLNRSWVFRVPFLDSFQGPVLANFASDQFGATNACIMYDPNDEYPLGLAESFRSAWAGLHGAASVVATETFSPNDHDFSEQLNRIVAADCDFLFLPQYAPEITEIVDQAHDLGLNVPVLGSDSWGSTVLLDECGANCDGYFFSTHFIAAGASGEAKAFVDRYEARFGETAIDVAALTWDAMQLASKALQNCGSVTGDVAQDRTCLRDGIASISDFDGITGNMTFNADGDPVKCAVIAQIKDGGFTTYGSACP